MNVAARSLLTPDWTEPNAVYSFFLFITETSWLSLWWIFISLHLDCWGCYSSWLVLYIWHQLRLSLLYHFQMVWTAAWTKAGHMCLKKCMFLAYEPFSRATWTCKMFRDYLAAADGVEWAVKSAGLWRTNAGMQITSLEWRWTNCWQPSNDSLHTGSFADGNSFAGPQACQGVVCGVGTTKKKVPPVMMGRKTPRRDCNGDWQRLERKSIGQWTQKRVEVWSGVELWQRRTWRLLGMEFWVVMTIKKSLYP